MKKLFYYLSISAVFLTSCSSDDNGSSSSDAVLLKKTIDTYADGEIVTNTFTYDGTKLLKVVDTDGFTTNFTYTGDLITQIDYKAGSLLEQSDKFTYNSDGKMATYTRYEFEQQLASKEVYEYNANGSITVKSYSGDLDSQTNGPSMGLIEFEAGEISQITSENSPSYTYSYDTKNNPFKNVKGYGLISYADSSASGIMHNITSETSIGDSSTTTTYTYNASDYPVTSIETYSEDVTSTQYFYN